MGFAIQRREEEEMKDLALLCAALPKAPPPALSSSLQQGQPLVLGTARADKLPTCFLSEHGFIPVT